MKVINMYAAKTHLSRLVEEAVAGEDIVIAKGGRPVVRLVPFTATTDDRVPGSLRGRITIHASFDAAMPPDLAAAFGSAP
jgi:prevent-host-death family protein